MEIIFEILLRIALEVALQGVFELGGRGLVAVFSKEDADMNPLLAIFGYLLMGAIGGALSIFLIPMHLFQSPVLQTLNLAITPIALGSIFEAFGRWETKQDKPRRVVDQFSYGFTFALSMGLVRFFFAG